MSVDTTRAPYRKKWERNSSTETTICMIVWRDESSDAVYALRTLSGRLFQEAGPATANARLPSSRRVCNMNRMSWS